MPNTQTIAFVSLGSNMGESESYLRHAMEHIDLLPGVRITKASSIYWTEPQGMIDQPWFANNILMLECGGGWTAQKLLKNLLAIENTLGRVRTCHWGPRTIDLDLLLFGGQQIDEPDLIVPHPRLYERAFVLVPLLEIAPDLTLPSGKSARCMLSAIRFKRVDNRIWQQDEPSTSRDKTSCST